MKKQLSMILTAAMLSVGLTVPQAQAAGGIIAFPGADGAGKYATGGRGGKVYHVTNLNDSGTGSFRDAVSGSNRVVVFDVGGTIELKSDVVVKSNVTILGQTAPGGAGITLCGGKIGQGGSNQIIRYISSRPGEKGSGEYDAWGGSDGSNSIIDHCSIGWSNDEQWGLYSNNMNQTVQYSIIGPSNCVSTHAKGAHGFGVMFGKGQNSWHHNMIAHNISRNFRGKVEKTNSMDFVNNVMYNWGYQTGYGTLGHINYVGNYLKAGNSTKGSYHFMVRSSGSGIENYKFFVNGNTIRKRDGSVYSSSIENDNWGGVGFDESTYRSQEYFPVYDINGNDASVAPNAQSAEDAFDTVLTYAGAGIDADSRPKIDKEVMEEARTGTGYLTGAKVDTTTDSDQLSAISKYNIKQVDYDDYYPSMSKKTIVDSDNDGMPDDWEIARGLNPNKDDASGDYLGEGYMNIEYYANDLTVNSFPEGTVKISPTITDLGEGFINSREDADAIKLNAKTISKVGDLTLPSVGTKHNSTIKWSCSTSDIKINENNEITKVKRPSSEDKTVTLIAEVTNGEYTVKKSVQITILSTATSWTASADDIGKTAGTELMPGLTCLDTLTGASLKDVTINGEDLGFYASSANNGNWNDGQVSGAAFKYVPTEDGFVNAYITSLGENKTAYIIKEGENIKDCASTAVGTDGANQLLTAKVKAGETYYIFVSGSKGRFAKIAFNTSAPYVLWKASADASEGEKVTKNISTAESMIYTESAKTIDSIEFNGNLKGQTNPRENGLTGSSLHFTAPADGWVTVYYKIGAGKTFIVNDTNGNEAASYTNDSEESDFTSTTAVVKGGTTYYMYVSGSKAEFYGVGYQQSGENVKPGETENPVETVNPIETPAGEETPQPTAKPDYKVYTWNADADIKTGETLAGGITTGTDMTYTEKATDINGVNFKGYVVGTVNPKITEEGFIGTGLILNAPCYGEFTVYMEVGAGKTIKIVDSAGDIIKEYTPEVKEKAVFSAKVEKGKTYYAYVEGSNARIYGAELKEEEASQPTNSPSPTPDEKETISFNVMSGDRELDKLESGIVTAAVSMENPDGRIIYAAQYDNDGRLIGISNANAKESTEMTITIDDNAQKLALLVWNGQECMCDAKVLNR